MNKNLGNKNVYKIFLSTVKYIPIITAFLKIISTMLNYFNIVSPILIYLCGTSLPFTIVLLLIATVFKFCYLYKMPIYYIFTIDGFILMSKYVTIDVLDLYRIYFIISGIFMIIYIVYAYKNRNKPKRDYIKEFCNRYCN